MNHRAVLFHLKEAKEQLDRTITEMAADPDFDVELLRVEMGHLYHHLNTAWNGKDASLEWHRECSQENFDAWRKFPPNVDLMLEDQPD